MNRITTPLVVILFLLPTTTSFADIVTMEELPLDPNSFYNGGPVTNTNGWTATSSVSGVDVQFGNSFDSRFGGFWNGFSYSNVIDTDTAGFGNQYASIAGGGASGSQNYAVGYAGSNGFINLPANRQFTSVQLTNTTYAAISMRDGDQFAKKFGGDTGDDPDYFSVVITGFQGLDGSGAATGSVEHFLADFRFADNSMDYIADDWRTQSLAALGNARSLTFSFTSSDVGQFGINTPTYFALDNLQFSAVPEPSGLIIFPTLVLLALRRNRPMGNS